MRSWQKLMVLVLAAALIGSLSAGAVFGKTLTVAVGGEAPGLDPIIETDVPSFERINAMMESLVVFNHDMELEGRLATDWGYTEDGLTLWFDLREGVLFHHGREFTADDVKFTFETILDPEVAAQNRSLYVDIAEIEVINDYRIEFHLANVNGFLINNMARLPIVPADVYQERGAQFRQSPIGTGPYEFSRWIRDDRFEMTAFEQYWGGTPNIDTIVFRPIPEQTTKLLAFEAGEADIVTAPPQMEFARLEDDPGIDTMVAPSPGYTYMGFNTRNEALSDVRVRQAISYLIDRNAIVDQLLYGLGIPGHTQVIPSLPWYNEDAKRYDYNPERAMELLAEAGYGPDNPLSLRLHTNEETAIRGQIAEVLGYLLNEMGIQVDISIEEWGAFLSRIQQTEDYDLFIMGWGGQLDPDRASIRQFNTEGSANYTYYSNARVDELTNLGPTVPGDSQESIDIYREVQAIVAEEVPYAFIFYTVETAAKYPHVTGWALHPYTAQNWVDAHLIDVER